MSWNVSIFFNAPDDLENIVHKLEDLWLITFRREKDPPVVRYRYEGLGLLIDVWEDHGMVDDMGIAFTRYAYQICLDVIAKVDRCLRRSYGLSAAVFLAH